MGNYLYLSIVMRYFAQSANRLADEKNTGRGEGEDSGDIGEGI